MEQREALRLALVERAKEARKNSTALFRVCGGSGAAVRRRLGVRRVQHRERRVHRHLLRRAHRLFPAVNDGKRQFKAIAIVGGRKGQEPRELCAPCGVCRQVMAEFCGPEFEIVMTDGKELQVKKLEDLLPLAFGPGNLQ